MNIVVMGSGGIGAKLARTGDGVALGYAALRPWRDGAAH